MIAERQIGYEVQDHNIAAGYVTYIVDIWIGDRHDPASPINRYIGVWHEEDLEDDPDWSAVPQSGYHRQPKPEPLLWEMLETVKKRDESAALFQRESDSLNKDDEERWVQPQVKQKRTRYQAFMSAIDRLAVDDTDQEAWDAVDAWFKYQNELHEK